MYKTCEGVTRDEKIKLDGDVKEGARYRLARGLQSFNPRTRRRFQSCAPLRLHLGVEYPRKGQARQLSLDVA